MDEVKTVYLYLLAYSFGGVRYEWLIFYFLGYITLILQCPYKLLIIFFRGPTHDSI